MERFNNIQDKEEIDLEDYEETAFYKLLRRLPDELAVKHVYHINESKMDDIDAVRYLENILDRRREARTETEISDTSLKNYLIESEPNFLKKIETDIFTDENNSLGFGYTARVKRYDLNTPEGKLSLAIKYLVTPTEKTLSASGEHDMLHEVELLKNIEEVERDADFKYISVPHPFFHHKNGSLQCYGMQMIDGYDLERVFSPISDEIQMTEDMKKNLLEVDTDLLYDEIEEFYNRMHTYCIHGDIKPKNIMVDRTGKFYLIDFGQSVLKNDISESGMDQYQNLMENDLKLTKEIIRSTLRRVKENLNESEL